MTNSRFLYAALIVLSQHLAFYCLSIRQTVIEQHINPAEDQSLELDSSPKRTQQSDDPRRPIWNLAHMVNSIKELDYRLDKGANAIEVDVTFSSEGEPLYTYHGPPCDCWRHCHQQENFNDYLLYLNEITSTSDGIGRNLSLLVLDLKLESVEHSAKIKAGRLLAQSLRDNLFYYPQYASGRIQTSELNFTSPIKVILSISHVTDIDLVHNFIHELEKSNSTIILSRIGFDVGMNDDIDQIEHLWSKNGRSLNLWQGDGYTNCISPFYNLGRLFKAIAKRNDPRGYPKKVYHWTIDLHDRIRESLTFGVDAIITNHPERLNAILKEPEMAHSYRLATPNDDPFRKFTSTEGRSHGTARYQRSAQVSGGGFFGSLVDVISSWIAYIREIPMLSLPTTSRFLPKVKRHRQAASSTITAKSQQSEMRNDGGSSELLDSSSNKTHVDQGGSLGSQTEDYVGPKWYTKLAANLLLAALKLMLPVET